MNGQDTTDPNASFTYVRLTIEDDRGYEATWAVAVQTDSDNDPKVENAISVVAERAAASVVMGGWLAQLLAEANQLEPEAEPGDGLEPSGSWPGFHEIELAGLPIGQGPGPEGYWSWEDVARALINKVESINTITGWGGEDR